MLKAVHLELVPFSIENDLITPTFKLKRPQLLKYYKVWGHNLYTLFLVISLKNVETFIVLFMQRTNLLQDRIDQMYKDAKDGRTALWQYILPTVAMALVVHFDPSEVCT